MTERLTRDELLAALDYQIKDIEEETRRPGWTIWALLGALGTLLWFLPEQYNYQSNLQVAGEIIILTLLMGDAFRLVFVKPKQPWQHHRNQLRYRAFRDNPSLTRNHIVFLLIRNIIAFLLCEALVGPFRPPASLTYFGLWIFSSCSLLLYTFKRKPEPYHTVPSEKFYLFVDISNYISAIWALSIFFLTLVRVVKAKPSLNPSDVRLGLVVSFLIFVAQMIVAGENERPLIDKLKAIRRDLAFARITLDDAMDQADLLLSGLTSTAYLKASAEDLSKDFELIKNASRNIRAKLEKIEISLTDIENNVDERSEKWISKAREIALSIDVVAKEIALNDGVMRKAYSKSKRLIAILERGKNQNPPISLEALKAGDEAITKAQTEAGFYDEVKRIYHEITGRYTQLSKL